MAPSETSLDELIVRMLHETGGKEMSLREIEQRLQKETNRRLDTFDVRDAVWRLIDKGRADFTLLRDLKAVGS